jgi:hypothetical protein
MPKSTRKRTGKKPAVAFAAQEYAVANIQAKADVLEQVVLYGERGNEEAQRLHTVLSRRGCSFLPCTLRQFMSWNCASDACSLSGVEEVAIRRIGNGTLNRYPEQRARVVALLAQIARFKRTPLSEREPTPIKIRRALTSANAKVAVLERVLIDLRRANDELTRERDDIKRQWLDLTRRFREELQTAKQEGTSNKSTPVTQLRRGRDVQR